MSKLDLPVKMKIPITKIKNVMIIIAYFAKIVRETSEFNVSLRFDAQDHFTSRNQF